ncbi:MAG: FprA family A-type flavoprotein [Ruminococcus sp.]|nr:FprA family A-type flavoprotein [Ruminococcus sp.]
MKITDSVAYIGVNDREIDLFEGQYHVPDGISYNSYVVFDEKIVVMDTVDKAFCDEWLEKLEESLDGKKPDYLVVSHMEPDHSANIVEFCRAYPDAVIVGNSKTFMMAERFFGSGFSKNRLVVKDGETLNLGSRTLKFIFAPMVHWPEVMVTYDDKDKLLFSADGFGKFGACEDINSADESGWADEARRYYIGIVGKYGVQVQALLKKAAALDIEKICPLHGPVLSGNLSFYLDLYDKWSSYTPETDGVFIAYSSVYGNTKAAALELKEKLAANGTEVEEADLSRDDMARSIANAFKYSRLVIATPTYNGDVFPSAREFISGLNERSFKKRTVGIIENGAWAPMASRVVKAMLEKCRDLTFAEPVVTVAAALDEKSREQIEALAESLS